jgi:hypothetical protein
MSGHGASTRARPTLRCGGLLRAITGLPLFLNTGAAARSSARATRSSCSAAAAAACGCRVRGSRASTHAQCKQC